MDDNKLKDTLAYFFKFHAQGGQTPGEKQMAHKAAASAYLEAWAVLFNSDTREDALTDILAREPTTEFKEELVRQMQLRISRMEERLRKDVQTNH